MNILALSLTDSDLTKVLELDNFIAEIALREQQDFVDKIFLIESSFTHKGVRNIEHEHNHLFLIHT